MGNICKTRLHFDPILVYQRIWSRVTKKSRSFLIEAKNRSQFDLHFLHFTQCFLLSAEMKMQRDVFLEQLDEHEPNLWL